MKSEDNPNKRSSLLPFFFLFLCVRVTEAEKVRQPFVSFEIYMEKKGKRTIALLHSKPLKLQPQAIPHRSFSSL